jgi:hypothetical protein
MLDSRTSRFVVGTTLTCLQLFNLVERKNMAQTLDTRHETTLGTWSKAWTEEDDNKRLANDHSYWFP